MGINKLAKSSPTVESLITAIDQYISQPCLGSVCLQEMVLIRDPWLAEVKKISDFNSQSQTEHINQLLLPGLWDHCEIDGRKSVRARGSRWPAGNSVLRTHRTAAHMNSQHRTINTVSTAIGQQPQDLGKPMQTKSQNGEQSGHTVPPQGQTLLAVISCWERGSPFSLRIQPLVS